MVCNAFRTGAGAGSWSAASRAAMADVSASLRGMGRLSCIRSDLAASAAAAQAIGIHYLVSRRMRCQELCQSDRNVNTCSASLLA